MDVQQAETCRQRMSCTLAMALAWAVSMCRAGRGNHGSHRAWADLLQEWIKLQEPVQAQRLV